MTVYEQMARDAGYRGDEAKMMAAAIEDDHRRQWERQWEEDQQDDAEIEWAMAEDACPNCGPYWHRMESEGYWRDGQWTDRGVREFIETSAPYAECRNREIVRSGQSPEASRPVSSNGAPTVSLKLRGDGTAGYPLPGVFDQAVEELHELERIIASEWERRHPGENLPRPADALRMMLRGWVNQVVCPS